MAMLFRIVRNSRAPSLFPALRPKGLRKPGTLRSCLQDRGMSRKYMAFQGRTTRACVLTITGSADVYVRGDLNDGLDNPSSLAGVSSVSFSWSTGEPKGSWFAVPRVFVYFLRPPIPVDTR